MTKYALLLTLTTILTGCSLAPDFVVPDMHPPEAYKEEPAEKQAQPEGTWKPAEFLEKADRGSWWTLFQDDVLNDLETQATNANQSAKAAAARVEEARATVRANAFAFLPDVTLGGNALRAKPSGANLAAFGSPGSPNIKPYTMFNAQGTASYEVDLFVRVRSTENAFRSDADALEADYRSVLLALQADVAQHYFLLRALDTERQLLREAITIREEAARIMQRRFELGDVSAQDQARTQSELADARANLIDVERRRTVLEHALAVLLGKMPGEFAFAEAPLADVPPEIPAGIPSTLLERRPDITAAQHAMAAANARIGVARAAYFPSLFLTAAGGYQSTELGDLFKWANRSWALGQLAGNALSMTIFNNGRTDGRVDAAKAAYREAVANYRQQVLVAFRDVEDSLSDQQKLADQAHQLEIAAATTAKTLELTRKRYDAGDVSYFEVVDAERNSLASGRASLQIRGQRFFTTIALVRALGGGWAEQSTPQAAPIMPSPEAAPLQEPLTPAPTPQPIILKKPVEESTPIILTPPAPEPAMEQPIILIPPAAEEPTASE